MTRSAFPAANATPFRQSRHRLLVVFSSSLGVAAFGLGDFLGGGKAHFAFPPRFTAPIFVMLVSTWAVRPVAAAFQGQRGRVLRQKSFLAQLMRDCAAQRLCIHANRMPM